MTGEQSWKTLLAKHNKSDALLGQIKKKTKLDEITHTSGILSAS